MGAFSGGFQHVCVADKIQSVISSSLVDVLFLFLFLFLFLLAPK